MTPSSALGKTLPRRQIALTDRAGGVITVPAPTFWRGWKIVQHQTTSRCIQGMNIVKSGELVYGTTAGLPGL